MDRWLSRGQVFGEWTFRGHNFGIFEFTIETNRSDWKLIHKHEEKELLKSKNKLETFKLPDSFPLPPLIVRFKGTSMVRGPHPKRCRNVTLWGFLYA